MILVGGITTIPGREEGLKTALESLAPQLDRIHVTCHRFEWGHYLDDGTYPNVQFHYLEPGSFWDRLEDGAKFYPMRIERKGHVILFTCDDDIRYHDEYVRETLMAFDQYGFDTAITYHGRSFPTPPVPSYYRSANLRLRCFDLVTRDHDVQVGGTGCMAISNPARFLRPMEWEPLMADINVSSDLHDAGIPIVVRKHPENWCGNLRAATGDQTIYHKFQGHDEAPTKKVNDLLCRISGLS